MPPRWNKINQTYGVLPKPRHGHRAVAIKELIVVFGGGNEGILADLVVFNTMNKEWFRPTVNGNIPPGRASFGFVVDKTRILMFGGMLEYMECSNDLYELRVSRWEWKKLKPKPPADLKPPPLPRLGHSFTLIDDKVYMFGGLTLDTDNTEQNSFYPRYLNDLYILDCSQEEMSWHMVVAHGLCPSPRESHSAVAYKDPQGMNKLIIYGGMSGCRLGDIWILDVNSLTWTEVEPFLYIPLPRSLHTATLVGGKMYVFGGWVPVATFNEGTHQEREWKVTNQLVCYDIQSNSWKELSNCLPNDMPKARAGHIAVEVNNRIYMWSGRDGYRRAWNNQVCCNDLWYLDIEPPPSIPRPQLVKGELKSLQIQWIPVSSADCYLLQIQKFEIPTPAKKETNSNLHLVKSTFDPHHKIPNLLNDAKNSSNEHPNAGFESNLFPKDNSSFLGNPQVNSKPPQIGFHKLPSFEMIPVTRPATALAIRPNIAQLRPLRPLTMVKLNNVNDLGSKSFFARPANFLRLKTAPGMRPPAFFVTNPALKLVAVNKDSKIKLIPTPKSHVLSKPSPGSLENVMASSLISQENFNQNKKIKLSPDSEDGNLPAPYTPKSLTDAVDLKLNPQNPSPENAYLDSLNIPSFPENVKIKKCKVTEGIYLSWSPPPKDVVTSYTVTLLVKEAVDVSGHKVIYHGSKAECYISKSFLDNALIDDSGGTRAVKFMIAAKNYKGGGPSLVVKWVLNSSQS